MSIRKKYLSDLLQEFPCKIIGNITDIQISAIEYDSRLIESGSLFAALRGKHTDGHAHILSAVKAGASAVLSEEAVDLPGNVPQIICRDSAKALALISRAFYDTCHLPFSICAITGTNGKTTTTYIMRRLARYAGLTSSILGTLGFKSHNGSSSTSLTTPMSPEIHAIFRQAADNGIKDMYMEASSIAAVHNRLHGISFDLLIFSNLSRDHLDYHGNMENYYLAKRSLFSQIRPGGKALINIDDEYGRRLCSDLKHSYIHTYSLYSEEADFYFKDLWTGSKGTSAVMNSRQRDVKIKAGIIGEFNASNILAATAAFQLLHPGLLPADVDISDFHGAPGRLEVYKSDRHGIFIVDFAHTPDAMKNIYQSLPKPAEGGKIRSIFGAGGDRDKGKRPEMGETADRYSNEILLCSDNPRSEAPLSILKDIEKGIKNTPYSIVENRAEAIEKAMNTAGPNDISIIFGKGGENYQEIAGIKRPWSDSDFLRGLLEIHGS